MSFHANFAYSKSASTEPTVGIGRPVSGEWLEQLSQTLESTFQSHMTVEFRRAPGITYVSPSELSKLSNVKNLSEENTIVQVRTLLASLALDETIHLPTMASQTSLEIVRFAIFKKTSSSFKLQAQVEDVSSTDYECGYLAEGERAELRRALGLKPIKREEMIDYIPRRTLMVGSIMPYTDDFDPTKQVKTIRELTAEDVPIYPIGPIVH